MRWFWTVVSSFTQEELARLLQFTTGSSQLPPGGFAALCPSFQIIAAPTHSTLPTAHTWHVSWVVGLSAVWFWEWHQLAVVGKQCVCVTLVSAHLKAARGDGSLSDLAWMGLFLLFYSFNQLCLPTYDSYEEVHKMLQLAISEGCEGFGMLWFLLSRRPLSFLALRGKT